MTTASEFDVGREFARIVQGIGRIDDLAEARRRVVVLAMEALQSAGTALWHLRADRSMALDSWTDRSFMDLMSDIVGSEPDGPAFDTMRDRRTTVADDFAVETRWPRYTRRLVGESPVRSAAVFPLGIGDRDLGVLAVYAHEPHHFSSAVVDLGAVFAGYAALALENVSLTQKTRQLETALASNRRIGMAIGILMSQHRLTETDAFDLLRVTSQNTNLKIALLAEEVIETGAIRSFRPA